MFLILDFTQSFKLALIHNGKLVNKELKIKKNISEILIIEIDKFLKKSHTNIKKIKSIYIITGPGSFTGIRTALTFAKALKLTMNLNVFGLSKFELINFFNFADIFDHTQKRRMRRSQCDSFLELTPY